MATVLLLERFPVAAGEERSFIGLLEDHLRAIRAAAGVLWADSATAADDAPSFVVLSEWRTPADLDAWASGEGSAAFDRRCDPLLRGNVTRRRFHPAP